MATAEPATERDRTSPWAWFAGSLFVGGVTAAIGVAWWRGSRGPPQEGDLRPGDAPPPTAEPVPGLPPPGDKAAGYPGAGTEPHGGVYAQLPTTGPGYVAKRPSHAWGTPETIASIQGAIERYNAAASEMALPHKVAIWDVSKKGGGKLPPHASHHEGRDVDVNFVIGPGEPRAAKLPTIALLPLLAAFLDDDNVKAIFLSWKRQREVWDALEVNPDLPFAAALKSELQYPLAPHTGRTRVRHWDGHGRHIHVRYRR